MLLYVYSTYTQAFHIVLLGLLFASALSMALSPGQSRIGSSKQESTADEHRLAQMRFLIFCMVSLFGLGLFLCGIWEVKSRYILQFAPMLIILACEGLARLSPRSSSFLKR